MHAPLTTDLADLARGDSFVRALPADPSEVNRTREVLDACYSFVTPTPVRAPRLLAWADEVGELLGLARPADPEGDVVAVLAGNRPWPGARPFAVRYGGHQFGHWAGQLGDGRAITVAEVLGARGQRFEVQLKGAGPTPYSRRADGRAVLRSSIREFLCSEAMHHLGVPTTRALSLVATGDAVVRDMFYDGRARPEPGAIVARVAPTFVRFGNFEILAAHGEHALLERLADYVVDHHYPELTGPQRHARLFDEVCRRTAVMVAHWMRVGFVHGVMNTDNMSILGLTIDYGPYGWLDPYDPDWTPNTTDAQTRRYRFGNQPRVAWWNLAQLGGALSSLIGGEPAVEAGLALYRATLDATWRDLVAAKLGLEALRPGSAEDPASDDALVDHLFGLLAREETDHTLFFLALAALPVADVVARGADVADAELLAPFAEAFYRADGPTPPHAARLAAWLRRYAARAVADPLGPDARLARMGAANPRVIPRNYLVQQAIDAAEAGDPSRVEGLLEALRRPYEDRPEHADLMGRRPEWARHRAGCSALSCSS